MSMNQLIVMIEGLLDACSLGHTIFPENLNDRQARRRAYALVEKGAPHIKLGDRIYFRWERVQTWLASLEQTVDENENTGK